MNRETTPHQRLFERIAEHTDRLDLRGNRVIVNEPIETPYDEYGIVDKQELFRRLIGSAATFHWRGSFEGPHHIMWPRECYDGRGYGAKRKIPQAFRGSASLKIIIHRDLHDYLHKVTERPRLPGIDVMEQYHREQDGINHLYDVVRFHGLKDFDMSPEEKDVFRRRRLHQELEHTIVGEVGLMPDHELLASLPFSEARQVVRSLARIQGLSNAAPSQKAFLR